MVHKQKELINKFFNKILKFKKINQINKNKKFYKKFRRKKNKIINLVLSLIEHWKPSKVVKMKVLKIYYRDKSLRILKTKSEINKTVIIYIRKKVINQDIIQINKIPKDMI